MLQLNRPMWSPLAGCTLTILALSGAAVVSVSAQQTDFRVLAGASPAGYVDATGGDARFNVPTGIAVDSAGALYVADSHNCFIRRITSAGVVTTFAGTIIGDSPCGSANGPGNVAQFSFAQGIAVDSLGTLYVADTFNHTIRKITPAGVVSTLAGQPGSSGSADGTGSAARFNNPRGVTVDSAGTVYVADTNNHAIRQITAAGIVTTLTGLAGSPGTADGTGTAARFNSPRGLAVDGAGTVYVADTNNHTIRKIAAGAVVTTLAGLAGAGGNTDGTGGAARFNSPRGMAVDVAGTMYVADSNNSRIRQVTAAGVVTTFAGTGTPGGTDGPAGSARFNNPEGVTVDSMGIVYVADTTSDTIRKIAGGAVTTLAGFVGSLGAADGVGSAARFAYPFGVATDTNNNVYVADRNNHTIRKITPLGEVTTFAGSAGMAGSTDGAGSAARFNAPRAVAVDGAGTVYVADLFNNTIRSITPAGVVSTYAGTAGSPGNLDGTGSAARFNAPNGVAVDSAGTVYVADANNHTIRKIAPGAIVTTLAGLAGSSGSADGTGNAARFNTPRGVAVDAAGTVFVADSNNHTIRQISPGGVVTTLAGMAGSFGGFDGTGSAARFGGPEGIAVDNDTGNVYVGDTGNHTIRKIAAGAIVTTISGCTGCIGASNWGRFNMPRGVAVDARGFLHVADTRNNTIRTTTPMPWSLVVDFGPSIGIWLRRATNWSQLHSLTAEAIVRVRGQSRDGLLVDFGPGAGLWFREEGDDGDVEWFQLHSLSPTSAAGLDRDGDGEVDSGVFDFAGQGLWLFDGETGEWHMLHGLNATHLVAANLDGAGGDELIADFPGHGLWIYRDNAWSQLHSLDVTAVVAADLDGNGSEDMVVNFPGFGVWSYKNGLGWSQVHGLAATRLAAGDLDGNGVTDMVIDFGASFGVWILRNGTTWAQLHALTTQAITIGDLDGNGKDEVIIDFGAPGLWAFQDGGGWQQVHSFNPTGIVTGRF